jgi:hypothetical protein
MRYRGAAVVASVEKKDKRKRPPMKIASVFAVAVTIVPIQTPKQPTKMSSRRPLQSDIQMNSAPTCTGLSMRCLEGSTDQLPSGRR